MRSKYYIYKQRAINLRKIGRTYGEIKKIIGKKISKSTLSHWFYNIVIPKTYQKRLNKIAAKNIQRAQVKALIVNKLKREIYLKSVFNRNKHLKTILRRTDVAKVALTALYLGEGSKDPKRGSLVFGSSDPFIISLFLYLLRHCYHIDEKKIRCTLQCRADQNIKKLEKFWLRITNIPLSRFYKARIDPRTINKPSQKLDYKGVCRIDYFSAEILTELLQIPKIIFKGP